MCIFLFYTVLVIHRVESTIQNAQLQKKTTYFQINKRQTLIDCPCMYIPLYVVHKHQRMYNIQRARKPNLQRLLKTTHLYFSIVIVKLIILNKPLFV